MPPPPQIIVASFEQLECRPHRLQQLQQLNSRVFGEDGRDLLSHLRHGRTMRVALALHACADNSCQGAAGCMLPATGEAQSDHLQGFAVYKTNSLTAHVVRVAVAPEARRCGLGRALLQVSNCGPGLLWTIHANFSVQSSLSSRCKLMLLITCCSSTQTLSQFDRQVCPLFTLLTSGRSPRTRSQAALSRAAAERRVHSASLHVAPDNAAAVGLYRRAGFAVDAAVQDYYGPRQPALRMVLDDLGGWLEAAERSPPAAVCVQEFCE
jgi:ribosomal protein S18 acetylase RimI-like enzyme